MPAPPRPGTRFAATRIWTIDINECGNKFYELYHIVRATPKSILVHRVTHFPSTLDVNEANAHLDKICEANARGIDRLGNEPTTPERFMLKHEDGQTFFRVNKGTACRRIVLGQTTPLGTAATAGAATAGGKRKRAK